jgi:hypothetical protein
VPFLLGEVDVPNLVSDIEQRPIFEWCMVKYESKNRFQKTHVEKRLNYVRRLC